MTSDAGRDVPRLNASDRYNEDMEKRTPLFPPKIEVMDDEMAKVMRTKSYAERLQIANDMYFDAREMLVHYLRSKHPDWDDARVNREASRRMSHGAF